MNNLETLPQTAESILNNPLLGETQEYYNERFNYNPLWDGENNNILNNLDDYDAIQILNLISGLFNVSIRKINICNDFKNFAIGFLSKKLPTKRQLCILDEYGLYIEFELVPYFGVHLVIRETE